MSETSKQSDRPWSLKSEAKKVNKTQAQDVSTMFVQVFETFLALHNFWLTTSSNPSNFLTTQSRISPSTWISTFFWYKCFVFTVGGVPILRVQKYQEFETVVTLGDNEFGWEMMTVWLANVTQMSCFCKQNLVFCPPSQQQFTSL